MLKQPQLTDDLFEKSSMSFGEHLEELRRALVKSFLWLALGTCVGLIFANTVVHFISQPLRKKMDDFYIKQSADKYKRINGKTAPEELLAWMKVEGVMPEQVYVLDHQVKSLVKSETANPPHAEPTKASETTASTDPPTAADSPTASASPNTSESPSASEPPSSAKKPNHQAAWIDLDANAVTHLQPLMLMRPIPNRLSTFDALEGFLIWLKAALLVGAIVGSPGIFYHLWEFLASGLYPHERRYVYIYLPLSIVLFVSGVCLAFFVIFELVIEFLLTYNEGMDIDFSPRLKDYISFALFLPLGFGIAFQLPMIMLALNRFGIVSVDMYVSKWRIAVLAIAFISMVLTPADAYSMVGMFVPLTILYFFGIALCKYMPKGPGVGSGAFDPA